MSPKEYCQGTEKSKSNACSKNQLHAAGCLPPSVHPLCQPVLSQVVMQKPKFDPDQHSAVPEAAPHATHKSITIKVNG